MHWIVIVSILWILAWLVLSRHAQAIVSSQSFQEIYTQVTTDNSPPVLYVQATNTPDIYKPIGDGYCVAFVQAHGFSQYRGNAWQWKEYINSQAPKPGEVVVLNEGTMGHVALVISTGDKITIMEQNYVARYIVSQRELNLNDPSIIGFIK